MPVHRDSHRDAETSLEARHRPRGQGHREPHQQADRSFADIHTPEDIESAIRTARESFAGDPVRDYVPILYEAQFVDAAAQLADTPTYDALERMLDAVSKSYR